MSKPGRGQRFVLPQQPVLPNNRLQCSARLYLFCSWETVAEMSGKTKYFARTLHDTFLFLPFLPSDISQMQSFWERVFTPWQRACRRLSTQASSWMLPYETGKMASLQENMAMICGGWRAWRPHGHMCRTVAWLGFLCFFSREGN